jgi:hypothetical protein
MPSCLPRAGSNVFHALIFLNSAMLFCSAQAQILREATHWLVQSSFLGDSPHQEIELHRPVADAKPLNSRLFAKCQD